MYKRQAYILTRALDFDVSAEARTGTFSFIEEGTIFADAGLVMSNHEFVALNDATGNQGKVQWTQFSGAGAITAGDGLSKTGNTIAFDLTANKGLHFVSNKIEIELKSISGLVADSDGLHFDLGASGIEGTLAIGDGGTGQTGATAGFDALSPVTTRGDLIIRNASNNVRLAKGCLLYTSPSPRD